jgi:hypothetical protein
VQHRSRVLGYGNGVCGLGHHGHLRPGHAELLLRLEQHGMRGKQELPKRRLRLQ